MLPSTWTLAASHAGYVRKCNLATMLSNFIRFIKREISTGSATAALFQRKLNLRFQKTRQEQGAFKGKC